MSSGFGLNGGRCHKHCEALMRPAGAMSGAQWLILFFVGPSRCFPFWQDVLACYVVNTTSDDDSGKRKCAPALEDYYECLHHKKEVGYARAGIIPGTAADSFLLPSGHKSTRIADSISESRSSTSSRGCTKSGRDKKSGTVEQGR